MHPAKPAASAKPAAIAAVLLKLIAMVIALQSRYTPESMERFQE
jgi:hypothetical protein